jgi:hypothetical protein
MRGLGPRTGETRCRESRPAKKTSEPATTPVTRSGALAVLAAPPRGSADACSTALTAA